jgi:hypothetical protein
MNPDTELSIIQAKIKSNISLMTDRFKENYRALSEAD